MLALEREKKKKKKKLAWDTSTRQPPPTIVWSLSISPKIREWVYDIFILDMQHT